MRCCSVTGRNPRGLCRLPTYSSLRKSLLAAPRCNVAVLVKLGLSAILALGILRGVVFCEEVPKKASVGPMAGVVVDAQGKPAAGAKVWVYAFYWENEYHAPTIAETVTDAQGRFQLAKTEWDLQGKPQVLYLMARDAQGRLAPAPRVSQPGGAFSSTDLRLVLQEVRVFQGRITDLAGQPIPKAAVRPTILNQRIDKSFQQLFFPDVLVKEIQATTAADGSFSLRGVPSQGSINLTIAAPGFSSPHAACNVEKTVTIRLARAGSLRGALLGMKEAGIPGRTRLFLRPDRPSRSSLESQLTSQETTVAASFGRSLEAQSDGSFSCDEVPAGKYVIELRQETTRPGEQLRGYLEKCPPFEVKPNETASVSLQLRPAIPVHGKVIDKKTKAGVPEVRVYLSVRSPDAESAGGSSAVTDAKGAFTIYTRPGTAMVNVHQLPGNYIQPRETPTSGTARQPLEIVKETELPPIELEQAAGIEGIVVDEAGKPVAGAEIYYVDQSYMGLREPIRSDAAGKFSIQKASPGSGLPLKARAAKAVADQIVVKPGEIQRPLRLVVSEKKAFAMRGRIVEERGQAMKNVEVALTMQWRMGNMGYGISLGKPRTDEQGRFEFAGLWAGDDYQLQFSVAGFGKYESPYIHGEIGRTHDLGTITLKAAQATVEGIVTDSAGKPLADVRVFNSGDGPQPAGAQTDASGRFRLQGLFRGPAWVFAEKPEYRFTAIRTKTGARDATLRMLRAAEPVPPRPSPRFDALRKEQQELAKELAEKLWAEGTAEQKGRCIRAMAPLDLERAQKWSAQMEGKFAGTIRQVEARRIAEEDPEEAIALLAAEGSRGYYLLVQTATRLATSDPAKAMRFAEEAVVRARALNQPGRAHALAQCGLLLRSLGNKDAARKLFDEAAAMASTLPTNERQIHSSIGIIVAIGSHDPARASKLMEPIKDPRERQRCKAKIAAWCLDDLDKAESMLKEVESFYANRARVLLAYRLAADRPQVALRVAEKINSDGYNIDPKAYAYGWMAVAVAPRDKKLAWSLIDKAMAAYSDPGADSRRYLSDGGNPGQAALLAMLAQRTGYPDLERLVWQALALRPTSRQDDSPARVVESHVVMALYLALVDPDLARQMLEDLQSRSDLVGGGRGWVAVQHWVNAWGLVHPKHALEVARQATEADKKAPPGGYQPDYVSNLMSLWSLPSDEQFERITMNLMDANPPNDERW